MNNKESQQSNDKPQNNDTAKDESYTYENEHNENTAAANDEAVSAKEQDDSLQSAEQETAATAAAPFGAAAGVVPASADAPASGKKGGAGWIILSGILVVTLIVVLIKPPFGGSGKEAVATVNGSSITQDELYDTLVKANGEAALNSLIDMKLVQQEADAASITIIEDDLTDELNAIKLNFPTEQAFNDALAQNGFTEEALRENIRMSAMLRKVLESKTNVTDEAVKTYFDENQATLGGTTDQVRASHILVKTKEEADAIIADLKAGADFAETAKAKSTDGSAAQGGDLDFFGKGQMIPEFEEAAFALEIGEISEVVPSQYGFHIIKKTDFKAGTPANFEEKKEIIRVKLISTEVNTLAGPWIEELRAKAKITNTLTPEKPAAEDAASGAEGEEAAKEGEEAAKE